MNTSQGSTPDNQPQDEKGIVAVIVKTQGGFRNVIISVPVTKRDANPVIDAEIKSHIPDGEVCDWRQIGTSTRGISAEHAALYETDDYEQLS